jgi:hypothetical protein
LLELPIETYGNFAAGEYIAEDLVNRLSLFNKNYYVRMFCLINYCYAGLWHSLVFFFFPYFALAPGNSPFANGWVSCVPHK